MSNTELPAFVAELEALEAKATPGPWKSHKRSLPIVGIEAKDSSKGLKKEHWIKIYHEYYDPICLKETHDRQYYDARLMAKTRNALPALLALVRQLRGENAALKIQASKYAYECELAKRERDRAEARASAEAAKVARVKALLDGVGPAVETVAKAIDETDDHFNASPYDSYPDKFVLTCGYGEDAIGLAYDVDADDGKFVVDLLNGGVALLSAISEVREVLKGE